VRPCLCDTLQFTFYLFTSEGLSGAPQSWYAQDSAWSFSGVYSVLSGQPHPRLFSCLLQKLQLNIHDTIVATLSAQCSGMKGIPNAVQPLPASESRAFHHSGYGTGALHHSNSRFAFFFFALGTKTASAFSPLCPLPRRCVFMRLATICVLVFTLGSKITSCDDVTCELCGYNQRLYPVSMGGGVPWGEGVTWRQCHPGTVA
jgi:hypothetical protein